MQCLPLPRLPLVPAGQGHPAADCCAVQRAARGGGAPGGCIRHPRPHPARPHRPQVGGWAVQIGWTGRLDWLEDKLWRLLDFTCVGIPPTPLHSHTPSHHHPPLPRPRPFLPAAPRLWTPTTSISQPLASMSEPRYPEPLACELSAPALASAASSSSFWAAPHHQQTDPPGMHACC